MWKTKRWEKLNVYVLLSVVEKCTGTWAHLSYANTASKSDFTLVIFAQITYLFSSKRLSSDCSFCFSLKFMRNLRNWAVWIFCSPTFHPGFIQLTVLKGRFLPLLLCFCARKTSLHCKWTDLDFNDSALEIVQHDYNVVRVRWRVCAVMAATEERNDNENIRREIFRLIYKTRSKEEWLTFHLYVTEYSQFCTLLPVNLVDFIRAPFP